MTFVNNQANAKKKKKNNFICLVIREFTAAHYAIKIG